jgi:hypothetical protein
VEELETVYFFQGLSRKIKSNAEPIQSIYDKSFGLGVFKSTKTFTNKTIAPTASSFYQGSKQAAAEQYEHSKRRSRVRDFTPSVYNFTPLVDTLHTSSRNLTHLWSTVS